MIMLAQVANNIYRGGVTIDDDGFTDFIVQTSDLKAKFLAKYPKVSKQYINYICADAIKSEYLLGSTIDGKGYVTIAPLGRKLLSWASFLNEIGKTIGNIAPLVVSLISLMIGIIALVKSWTRD